MFDDDQQFLYEPDGDELPLPAVNGAPGTAGIYPFRRPTPARPANHGKAWTPEHSALLVQRIRVGDELPELESALGRTKGSLLPRMRRLLPPDNREHPPDLLLPALRDYLTDEAAEWERNLLKSSPPRPIIQPPAIVRTGYGGIPDDDLVRIAYALIAQHGSEVRERCPQVVDEVHERGLDRKIVAARAAEIRYSPGCPLSETDLWESAENWVCEALSDVRVLGRHWRTW